MNTAFIIPTAISDSSVPMHATEQCLQTIKSIEALPTLCGIGIVEYSAQPILAEFQEKLLDRTSFIAAYQRDDKINALANSITPLQSTTLSHIAGLAWFFGVCAVNNIFPQKTQIIVIEPGMTIDQTIFEQITSLQHQDKYIFAPPKSSTLSKDQTGGIFLQLNTQIWSLTSDKLEDIADVLNKSVHYTYERLLEHGHADLSHTLFKFINSSDIFFLKQLEQS
ncbi:hypothetical protein V757_12140 [Pelistega indica]|uniref:Uncharacterized protein n=1 Tax=Pelistega indica TaxID=1414851 RepID=V8FSI8_9BURK|nr:MULTISPECIES: hypothetical protein [Pelistega]ETD66856.1 hypothetical protein V757_12140 [Pelistega indica]